MPISKKNISFETIDLLEKGVPVTFGLIKNFNQSSLKMKTVQQDHKF